MEQYFNEQRHRDALHSVYLNLPWRIRFLRMFSSDPPTLSSNYDIYVYIFTRKKETYRYFACTLGCPLPGYGISFREVSISHPIVNEVINHAYSKLLHESLDIHHPRWFSEVIDLTSSIWLCVRWRQVICCILGGVVDQPWYFPKNI